MGCAAGVAPGIVTFTVLMQCAVHAADLLAGFALLDRVTRRCVATARAARARRVRRQIARMSPTRLQADV